MFTVHIVAVAVFSSIKSCTSFSFYNNACQDYRNYFSRVVNRHCYYNPDVLTQTPEIISRHGYPFETYTITTKDEYILTIFRIPPSNNKSNKQPVFLMHGIFNNNGVWVHVGNRSLAFYLADKGYDVWLGNIRGSNFAKSHKHYNISSNEYWNFNLDSVAYFDIGEQLKFITHKTRKSKSIIYIGHSMGTTLAFLYAAGYPSEAFKHLAGIVALAPVLNFKGVELMERLQEIASPLQRHLENLQVGGLFYEENVNKHAVTFCSTAPYTCKEIIEILAGQFTDQFRPVSFTYSVLNHCPSGTSVQVLKHFLQIAKSGRIRRYDYGSLRNIELYKLSEPASYDLGYIRIPVYLLYGRNDAFVSEMSVKELFQKLGSAKKELIQIPRNDEIASFNHIDFIMAKDIEKYLYTEILKIMKELEKN